MIFRITRHARLDGVALSLQGHWGGKRFPDETSAAKAAKDHAGSKQFTIEREYVK